MTKVTITVERDSDGYPITRTMEYPDKDAAVADAEGIAEFIRNYAR